MDEPFLAGGKPSRLASVLVGFGLGAVAGAVVYFTFASRTDAEPLKQDLLKSISNSEMALELQAEGQWDVKTDTLLVETIAEEPLHPKWFVEENTKCKDMSEIWDEYTDKNLAQCAERAENKHPTKNHWSFVFTLRNSTCWIVL